MVRNLFGTYVSQNVSDRNEQPNAVKSVPVVEIGAIGTVLADNGYASGAEESAVESLGVNVLVSVHAEQKQQKRKYDYRPAEAQKEKESKNTPMAKPWIKKMAEKFEEDANRRLYRLRKQTVEPVFGIVKHGMKFRQFLLRGLEKVNLEWNLVTLAYNFRRLHSMKTA